MWATTNKPLKSSYSEWEVSEWMANLHLPLRHRISDQMERDAAMTLQVMKETDPPRAVHLIFVTSPLLGYPAMRHWYTYFTIRLHRLISQTYGSAGEIFETAKGATILTPKRVAGYDAAGGEIHIMPHQILLCLADMEFLLQLFLEKQRKDLENGGQRGVVAGAFPCRILRSSNAAITTAIMCSYVAKKRWKRDLGHEPKYPSTKPTPKAAVKSHKRSADYEQNNLVKNLACKAK